MAVVPVNTVAVNYTRIGGLATASAKAHADAREKFDIEVKEDLRKTQDKVDALSKKLERENPDDQRDANGRVSVIV